MMVRSRKTARKTGSKTASKLPANHPAMVHRCLDGRIDRDEKAHAQIMEWIRIAKGGNDE